MKYTFLLFVCIAITAPPRPVARAASAPIPTCADGAALASLLNERPMRLGDGSYATCRIHNLPKGEHINATL